jgi:hypothetical protein
MLQKDEPPTDTAGVTNIPRDIDRGLSSLPHEQRMEEQEEKTKGKEFGDSLSDRGMPAKVFCAHGISAAMRRVRGGRQEGKRGHHQVISLLGDFVRISFKAHSINLQQ